MKKTIKIIAIIAFAVPALFLFTRSASLQTKETAGQKFKNIKVLNDMPADQMGKVMNQVSASLNVNCTFCHVSGSADFDKDGKKEKETAREMFKLTFQLNKDYFQGRPEVSCNTCHQGREHPQSAINLYPTPMPERPKQPDTKPTVDAILAAYAKAVGNASSVTSREIKAQRVEPDGKTIEDEEILQQPAKMALTTTYKKPEGNYVVREVFDGTSAAKTGNGSPIELKPDEAALIAREAQIFGGGDIKAAYAQLDFRFVDRIDGNAVYIVSATTADKQRETLYFDVVSGLLVRRVAGAMTILGRFTYQFDYQDYKDYGGVKLPSTVKFAMPGVKFTRKLVEVKNNVKIDASKFATK